MSGSTWLKRGMKVLHKGKEYEVEDWHFQSPTGFWKGLHNSDECIAHLKGGPQVPTHELEKAGTKKEKPTPAQKKRRRWAFLDI